ncbi:MAG: tautomerase family protein [Bifidobacteriaceae bacterium]|jgi:4-oxalocrotonate tautomerase|nr:tautomerase family protein [Bifidobacteriaceae bacterium]
MPYLRVRVASTPRRTTAGEIAHLLTRLAVDTLHKSENAVAIDLRFTDPENWFVGGKSLSERQESSFFIEIKLTDGTNSRDEKALFIRQAFKGMAMILGKISDTSYIVAHDVSSDSWGYGGKTQEYRYISES